jgi:MtfA peptidase
MYTAWARVFGEEFAHLVEDVDKHRKSDIDAYAATSPAEFFAVVTEVFFAKPVPFKRRHPELYEQLALFYRQDPAANTSTAPTRT